MKNENDQTSPTSENGAPAEPKAEAKAAPTPEVESLSDERQRSRATRHNKSRWVTRIVVIVGLILLVLLLLGWKYCKPGGGSGSLQAADGSRTQSMSSQMEASTAPKAQQGTCRLRVDQKGISWKGKLLSIPDAVKACGSAKRAELTVTGDATFGTVKQLRQALRNAGIAAVRR
ncbi:MAG: hypothetical protein ABI333_18245 [bacterium]